MQYLMTKLVFQWSWIGCTGGYDADMLPIHPPAYMVLEMISGPQTEVHENSASTYMY